ncbi:hypothetical protein ACHWQZ_G005678 [Mnemiopsis leidyi]
MRSNNSQTAKLVFVKVVTDDKRLVKLSDGIFVVLILSSGLRDMIIFLNILVNAAMQIAGALASAIFYSR